MRALPFGLLILLCCACRTELLEGASDMAGGADAGGVGAGGVDLAPSPAPTATGCSAFVDEASCIADITCKAVLLCGFRQYQGCADLDSPLPMFGPFCIVTRCSSHADEASCEADSACHSTYVQKTTLDCSAAQPDCNIGFNQCASGPASCVPHNAPACVNNPTANCAGQYVPEYSSTGCVIDCVRASACQEG